MADLNWDDCFAYYRLDESSGDVLDATGNNNTMTNNGAATGATGKIGDAYDFTDSESDYVESNSGTLSSQPTTEFSVNCWFKAESWNTWDQVVAKMNNGTGTATFQLGFYSPNGSVYFGVNDDVGAKYIDVDTALNPATDWYMATLTYKKDDYMRAYINGSEVGTAIATTGGDLVWSSSYKLYFGARKYGAAVADFFDGIIDEVSLWNVALDSTQISQLYNSGNGSTYPYDATIEPTALALTLGEGAQEIIIKASPLTLQSISILPKPSIRKVGRYRELSKNFPIPIKARW